MCPHLRRWETLKISNLKYLFGPYWAKRNWIRQNPGLSFRLIDFSHLVKFWWLRLASELPGACFMLLVNFLTLDHSSAVCVLSLRNIQTNWQLPVQLALTRYYGFHCWSSGQVYIKCKLAEEYLGSQRNILNQQKKRRIQHNVNDDNFWNDDILEELVWDNNNLVLITNQRQSTLEKDLTFISKMKGFCVQWLKIFHLRYCRGVCAPGISINHQFHMSKAKSYFGQVFHRPSVTSNYYFLLLTPGDQDSQDCLQGSRTLWFGHFLTWLAGYKWEFR